jgi:hypothetical protein
MEGVNMELTFALRLSFIKMSVGNPWLRHSSHPQEKEGGPQKKKKKKKKHHP